MNHRLMKLRIFIRAIMNRAWRWYRLPRENHIWREPEVPYNPEGAVTSFLRWVNRNRPLLSLIDCNRQYVLKVAMHHGTIRVNGYLASEDETATLARCQKEDGIYLFYQKGWEDAIGAKYAPFMTPVAENKERIYYDPRPVFSMEFPVIKLQDRLITVTANH